MQQIREKKEKRIRSILIDEFRLSYIASMNFQPVEQPTEECSRPISPTAALASEIYPKQFAYMRRMEFNDPDAEMIVCLLGKDPACKAFRLQVGMFPVSVDDRCLLYLININSG